MRGLIFAALAALLLVPLHPLPVQAQSGTPLRIVVIPTDVAMGAYYARDLGMFAKAGVNVTVDSMPSGAAITAGIIAGSIDIGFSNLLPIAQANARGIPVVVIFPGSLRTADRPNGALMVTKDSPIKTARDLNGKTIGVPQVQNMTQLAPMAWVDQNGGDSKTLKWAEIGLPLLGHALDEHRVDAIIATEPFYTEDRLKDRQLADPFNAIGTRFVGNCWFATKAFADAHPDVIARFITAIRESAHWANTHPNETIPIIAKYTKTSPEVLARLPHILIEENMVPKDFQPLLDSAAKYGMLAHPINADDIIYHPPAVKSTPVRLRLPDSGRANGGGVVLVHGAHGLEPGFFAFPERLAEHGYACALPDMFHRYPDQHARTVRERLDNLTWEDAQADLAAALDALRANGVKRAAILGYCFGGALALMAPTVLPFATAILYYPHSLFRAFGTGPLAPIDVVPQLRVPVLAHTGAGDANPSPADMQRLDAALTAAGVIHEFGLYDGAEHGFAVNNAGRTNFRPAQAQAANERTAAWLDATLASSSAPAVR